MPYFSAFMALKLYIKKSWNSKKNDFHFLANFATLETMFLILYFHVKIQKNLMKNF